MKYFSALCRAVLTVALVVGAAALSGGVALADPPVVPTIPTDAFPVMEIGDYIKPITNVVPKQLGVLGACLIVGGMLWVIDFGWRRFKRNK